MRAESSETPLKTTLQCPVTIIHSAGRVLGVRVHPIPEAPRPPATYDQAGPLGNVAYPPATRSSRVVMPGDPVRNSKRHLREIRSRQRVHNFLMYCEWLKLLPWILWSRSKYAQGYTKVHGFGRSYWTKEGEGR